MTLRKIARTLVLCLGSSLAGWFGSGSFRGEAPLKVEAKEPQRPESLVVLAAPGRVEGLSDAVNLSAGIDGVLSSVLVSEGQRIRKGEVIAVVDRHELSSELDEARAAYESACQAKARLERGSRVEERHQAADEVARATAMFNQARSHYSRQSHLLETDDVPRAAVDRARSDMEEAAAALRAAVDREKLVNAPPLPEELARANAGIDAAEQRVLTIQANIAKCQVRSPLSGTVVRRYMRPGEVVSVVFPQPIVSVIDNSGLRVRAEVDERDIGHVKLGQDVLVSADALGSRRVSGRVTRLGSQMGRKRVLTGDPAEKNDRDVLEVIIGLNEKDSSLVLGLRVTVQFLEPAQSLQPGSSASSRNAQHKNFLILSKREVVETHFSLTGAYVNSTL